MSAPRKGSVCGGYLDAYGRGLVTMCGRKTSAVARWEAVMHPDRRGPGWECPDFVTCPDCRAAVEVIE